MSGATGLFVCIDNLDCRLIVFVYRYWISVSTPSSSIADLTYLMYFVAVTATMSSASVELSAVIDCALD